MAYELLQCGNTQFAVDWDVIERLLRSYWTAKLQLDEATEVAMSDSRWYNPFSWSLPDISHIEVDWDTVGKVSKDYAKQDVLELQQRAKTDARSVAQRVATRIGEAAMLKQNFADRMRYVQIANTRRINQSLDDYDSHIEAARVVRDLSAEGLMVGASLMSGGAAVAVMGAGSALKGEAKWQDTGSIGAGVMEGVGSFAFAYIKLGKKFSLKQDMVLALVQAPYKAGTELVGGSSFSKAVASGSLKMTGPFVDRLFKIAPMKTIFDKVAVPVVVSYAGKNAASDMLSKMAGKAVQKYAVEPFGKSLIAGHPQVQAALAAAPSSPVMQDVTLTDRQLLNLSFVNMQTGIGNAW